MYEAVIGFEDDAHALADVAMPEPARCREVPWSSGLCFRKGIQGLKRLT